MPNNEPELPASNRRRRKVVVSGEGDPTEDPEHLARRSVLAFTGVALVGLWGMFAVGAPMDILHGVIWTALGFLLILFPPLYRVGFVWWLAGLAFLGSAALSFLPASWFPLPAWRVALSGLGVALGNRVTMQPGQSLELWAGLAVSVVAVWYLKGNRVSDRGQSGVALLLILGIAAYAGFSIAVLDLKPRWVWDPVETFGLFGNRNHTATVLVLGALGAMGLLMNGVRGKQGGVAGLAAVSLALCLSGLLGFSESRAGVLLLVGGSLAWITGLALGSGRYLSRRLVVASVSFCVIVVSLFWWTDNKLRNRVQESLARVELPDSQRAPAEDSGSEGASAKEPFDGRILIYRDTFAMLKHEPAIGVGLGQFPAVFPQYREQTAIHSKCWHPESNWLLLAAEAGWGTVVILVGALGVLFFKAFRAAKSRRGWPLSLATLLAALMVPVHGLFDVPAHHVGIAWPALVFLFSNFRPGEAPQGNSGVFSCFLFRGLGLTILSGGIYLLANTGQSGRTPAMLQSEVAARQISECYARDMAEKANPTTHPPALKPDGTPVDQLEVGQALVNEALRTHPLDPELYYWRGLLSLNFTDEEPITDQSFAAQRVLEPDWPEVPWRQALAWVGIDNQRTLSLWQEVLTRAAKGGLIKKDVYGSRAWWLKRMKSAASKEPALLEGVKKLEIGG